jgi:hypothetical protein
MRLENRQDPKTARTSRTREWLGVCLVFTFCIGCRLDTRPTSDELQLKPSVPTRDINAVLRDHDDEWMAIPGVVGVYVGLMDDDRTMCLNVMAAKKTPEIESKIPKTVEGYPVIVVETGIIRPLEGH